MLKRFRNSIFIMLLLICQQAFAAEQVVVVHDLQDNWLVFNSKSDSYIPYLDNNLEERATISFPVNLTSFKNYHLYIQVPGSTSIFFNQQMVAYDHMGLGLLFNIDSLSKAHQEETVLVTLYNPEMVDPHQISTAIVRTGYHEKATNVGAMEEIQLQRRSVTGFTNFFVTGLIVLLLLYAVLVNFYNKKLFSFYDLGRALSFNIREEVAFKGKIFDGANVPILLVHSFLISFVVLTIINAFDIWQLEIRGYGTTLLYWFLFSIGTFVFFIIKYWLLSLLGILFKLPLVNRHFLEYLRMSKIFFTITFILLTFLYFGVNLNLNNIGPIVINILILFLVLRVVLLYLKFIQSSHFNNLYLFSYLCGTEILPMVVGLKIILNR